MVHTFNPRVFTADLDKTQGGPRPALCFRMENKCREKVPVLNLLHVFILSRLGMESAAPPEYFEGSALFLVVCVLLYVFMCLWVVHVCMWRPKDNLITQAAFICLEF